MCMFSVIAGHDRNVFFYDRGAIRTECGIYYLFSCSFATAHDTTYAEKHRATVYKRMTHTINVH